MPDIWLYSNSLSLYFMGQYNIGQRGGRGGEYFYWAADATVVK